MPAMPEHGDPARNARTVRRRKPDFFQPQGLADQACQYPCQRRKKGDLNAVFEGQIFHTCWMRQMNIDDADLKVNGQSFILTFVIVFHKFNYIFISQDV